MGSAFAEERADGLASGLAASAFAPEPVTEEDFAELKEHSPFLRPLDLSQSLVLTGLAEVDGKLIATLRHRKTKETHVVSGSSSANALGWQLVGVEGDQNDLQTLSARISVGRGEVVSIGFDDQQLRPRTVLIGPKVPASEAKRIAKEAQNYRRGISADGFSGAPPRELADKLSRLSEEQRGRLIYQVSEMRKKGVSSEERRKVFVRMVDQALPKGR
tara:strand:- start:4688 stop:5338 length:651 start_codon:yes stop_codon:yes gene_type:complete